MANYDFAVKGGHTMSTITTKDGPQSITRTGGADSKLVKNGTLKVYKGAPHGMCTTHKDQVNADLHAFFKA